MSAWSDVNSSEGLKKAILAIVAFMFIVGDVSISIVADVGNYIIQALNKTGFTIPSSANYVAPIASLPSFLPLILMIVFIVIGVVVMIPALLKIFGNLGT